MLKKLDQLQDGEITFKQLLTLLQKSYYIFLPTETTNNCPLSNFVLIIFLREN